MYIILNFDMLGVSLYVTGEEKSVYVGNLPSSVSASDLEYEFKNFGRLKPDGVTVRSRKVCDDCFIYSTSILP